MGFRYNRRGRKSKDIFGCYIEQNVGKKKYEYKTGTLTKKWDVQFAATMTNVLTAGAIPALSLHYDTQPALQIYHLYSLLDEFSNDAWNFNHWGLSALLLKLIVSERIYHCSNVIEDSASIYAAKKYPCLTVLKLHRFDVSSNDRHIA